MRGSQSLFLRRSGGRSRYGVTLFRRTSRVPGMSQFDSDRASALSRLTGVVLAMLMLAAACSTGDGPASGTEQGLDNSGTPDAVAVVDELFVLANGNPGAPAASVLMAVDRGYSPPTVFAGVLAGRFDLEGIVLDDSGNHIAPSGPDLGFITGKTPLDLPDEAALMGPRTRLISFQGRDTVSREDLLGPLYNDFLSADLGNGPGVAPPPEQRPDPWQDLTDREARDRLVLLEIMRLVEHGATAEQIVQALVLGDHIECDPFFADCRIAEGSSAGAPAGTEPPQGESGGGGAVADSGPTECTLPSDLALPLTVELLPTRPDMERLSAQLPLGESVPPLGPWQVELRLNEDGTVDFTHHSELETETQSFVNNATAHGAWRVEDTSAQGTGAWDVSWVFLSSDSGGLFSDDSETVRTEQAEINLWVKLHPSGQIDVVIGRPDGGTFAGLVGNGWAVGHVPCG